METMEEMQTPTAENPPPPESKRPKAKKKKKKKQLQHSADIVFSKGNFLQTMPSLSQMLKGITHSIIGLDYVWEYRSPSKSVPPHYQCKLCSLSRLQHDIIDHVKGWKHGLRYLKKFYPDKVSCEEEDAIKDHNVRKIVKTAVAEVEKMEGRGQIKVILKEPCDVLAFKGLRSAVPKYRPPQGPGMGPIGPPLGSRFQSGFSEEYPNYYGPVNDYSAGPCGKNSYGSYMSGQDYFNPERPDMNQGFLSDVNYHQPEGSNGFGPCGGEDYRGSGLGNVNQRNAYAGDFQDNQSFTNKPLAKQELLESASDTSGSTGRNNLHNTLFSYLDNFKIKNEADAQLVLKVTQKLTDSLMEYRLGSVATVASLPSLPNSSTSFPSSVSKFPSQYSNNYSGPPRYSNCPPNHYQ